MRHEWVRTLRTSLQALCGFLPVIPLLVGALGVGTTAGVGATVVAIAAVLTRVMAIPEIDQWINGKLSKTEK